MAAVISTQSAHAGHQGDGVFGGSGVAFVLALGVHLLLVALIALGLRFEVRQEISGPIVSARLIENFTEPLAPRSDAPIEKPAIQKPIETQQAEPKPVEPDRRAERKHAQAEAARKQLAQKAAQEAAAQEAINKLRVQKALQAETAQRDAQTRALRRNMEVEERLRAESALRERMQAEALNIARARESGAQALSQSEVARYEALIRQKVERNWLRPAQSVAGLSCIARLRIAPGGEVLSAVIVRGSGDAAFDRSVEAAMLRASPLPVPREVKLFEHFRDLELKFKPEV